MLEIFEDDHRYVCVSHVSLIPCPFGDHHTVSNWPPDVERVLSAIKNN